MFVHDRAIRTIVQWNLDFGSDRSPGRWQQTLEKSDLARNYEFVRAYSSSFKFICVRLCFPAYCLVRLRLFARCRPSGVKKNR